MLVCFFTHMEPHQPLEQTLMLLMNLIITIMGMFIGVSSARPIQTILSGEDSITFILKECMMLKKINLKRALMHIVIPKLLHRYSIITSG